MFTLSTDKPPIRTNALGSIFGSVGLALLMWALNLLRPAWEWIKKIALWLWQVFTSTVSIPVWGLALGLGLLFALLMVARRSSTEPVLPPAPPNPTPELPNQELVVMHMLAQADGQSLGLDDIAGRLGVPKLRAMAVLEALETRYLIAKDDRFGMSYVGLTRAGLDFLLYKGMI